jgi:VanZ family protein
MPAMLPPAATAEARGRRAAFGWAAASALLLLVPLPPSVAAPAAWGGAPLDKLVHALLFLGLGRSWQRAWRERAGARSAGTMARLAVAAAATAWGGLLELAQAALGAGRAAEWGDLAADALGAAVAVWLARRL